MKKFLILILILIISTGCQAKYELNYEDKYIYENIKVITKPDKQIMETLKSKEPYAIFDGPLQTKYTRKFKRNLTNFEANYRYKFTPSTYNFHGYGRNCFTGISFVEDKNGYVLSTTEGFKCKTFNQKDLDSVKVEIMTNHIVYESNADEVKNNKYIWNIDNSNASKKRIFIKFGEVEKKNFFQRIIQYIKNNKVLFIIYGTILFLITFGIIYAIVLSRRNNNV